MRASAEQICSPTAAARDPAHFRPEQGRPRSTSRTQRVSRGDVNRAPARGSRQPRQQRRNQAHDVLTQDGGEDTAGARWGEPAATPSQAAVVTAVSAGFVQNKWRAWFLKRSQNSTRRSKRQTTSSILQWVRRSIDLSHDTTPLLKPISLQKLPKVALSTHF